MIKPPDGGSDSNGNPPGGAPDSGGHVPAEPRHDPEFLARYKEFRPTSLAVDHQTSVLVLLTFITIVGLFAYRVIPRESFPEVEIPMIAAEPHPNSKHETGMLKTCDRRISVIWNSEFGFV